MMIVPSKIIEVGKNSSQDTELLVKYSNNLLFLLKSSVTNNSHVRKRKSDDRCDKLSYCAYSALVTVMRHRSITVADSTRFLDVMKRLLNLIETNRVTMVIKIDKYLYRKGQENNLSTCIIYVDKKPRIQMIETYTESLIS